MDNTIILVFWSFPLRNSEGVTPNGAWHWNAEEIPLLSANNLVSRKRWVLEVYSGRLFEDRTSSIEPRGFQWPWVTSKGPVSDVEAVDDRNKLHNYVAY